MFKQKKQRESKEINAGSMADIAFLLLIFFLVTTTINAEKGIRVKLPPFVPEPVSEDINDRNVLSIKINKLNQVLVEGKSSNVMALREMTKEFIMNPDNRQDMPSQPTSAIVSIQNDRATSYEVYIQAYNEIKGAYNELWDEMAREKYGHEYETLPKDMKQKIQDQIPLVISEAEPTEY